MDLSDSCTSSNERFSPSVLQADGVDNVAASQKDFTLTDTPSPNEQQVAKVNEVTASLGNITLADTPSPIEQQVDKVNKVTASQKDFTLIDTPSPNEEQVDKVNEVTASLGNITLADTPSKNYVAVVQHTIQHHIEKSTSSGTVQINSHARETSETETQQPKATSDDESFLREQLKSLECPFTWKIQNEVNHETSDLVITRLSEKIEEISEDSAFQWRTFTLLLIICYENFRKGDTSESWNKQRECEKYLNPSDSKGTYERFFQATKDALSHVVYACKCHLLLEVGILNEARQTFHNVCKFEEMDNPCKAAIYGIRAAVSMEYGYGGTKVKKYCINIQVLMCSYE
jgi:hypothetical protein